MMAAATAPRYTRALRALRAPLAVLFFASFARAASSFLARILSAPLLGPHGFGLLALFLAASVAVNQLVEGGVVRTGLQVVARARGSEGDAAAAPRRLASAMIGLTILLLVAIALMAGAVAAAGRADPRLLAECAGAAFGALLSLLAAHRASFQAFERFGGTAVALAAAPIVTLACVAAVRVYGSGASTALIAAAYATPAALLVLVFSPLTARLTRGGSAGRADYGIILRFGGVLTAASIIEGLQGQSDVLLLGWLRAPAEVGIYASALAFASIVPVLSNTVNTFFGPRIAVAGAAGDMARVRELYASSVILMSVFGLLALGGVAGVVPTLLPRLLGAQYLPAVSLYPWLIPPAAILVMHVTSGAVFMGLGRFDLVLRVVAIVLVVTLIGHALLIPRMGAEGAAIAMGAGQVVSIVVSWSLVRRLTGSWPPVAGVLAAAMFAAAAGLAVSRIGMLPLHPMSVLALQGGAGLLAIGIAWRMFSITSHWRRAHL